MCFCVLTTASRRRCRAATFAFPAPLCRSSGDARSVAQFDPARGVMACEGIRQQLATPRRQLRRAGPFSPFGFMSWISSRRERSGAGGPQLSIGNLMVTNLRPPVSPCARAGPCLPERSVTEGTPIEDEDHDLSTEHGCFPLR